MLGHIVALCLTIRGTTRPFSKWLLRFYSLTSHVFVILEFQFCDLINIVINCRWGRGKLFCFILFLIIVA